MTREEFKKLYTQKTYIGDGAYVCYDGYYFILSAQRENGEHWIGLEPSVFQNLLAYRKQLYQDAENIEKDSE